METDNQFTNDAGGGLAVFDGEAIQALNERFLSCKRPPKTLPPKFRAANQSTEFVSALYEPSDILEARYLPSGLSVWFPASELSAQLPQFRFQNGLKKQGVYVGANPRISVGRKGDDDVSLARCLFADFDHMSLGEAKQRIEAAGLPKPTVVLNSGHGIHAYWRLAEPMAELRGWTRLQKGLAAVLDSDSAICNPERIMRLPGFLNHKSPQAECKIIICDASKVYSLAELEEKIPITDEGISGPKLAPPVGPTIQSGERNRLLTSLAGSMRRRGMSEEAIFAGLSEENARKCTPPLDEDEVQSIVQSVLRYEPSDSKAVKPMSVLPIAPYRPFPLEVLPAPIAAYIQDTAAAMGCDASYVALPLLASIAAAIGNSRTIELKSTWHEPAMLWTAVVADSGSLKSPAQEAALKFSWSKQKQFFRDHQRARALFEPKYVEWKSQLRRYPGSPQPEVPAPPQHVICSDITVEALADRLDATPRGTLVAVDELSGWFRSFGQYKSGKGADVSHYLSMHRAAMLKVDRKQGDKTTIFVPRAAASITGGIQPQVLARCLTPEFYDNGLAARLLLAMPPQKLKQWSEVEVSPESERAAEVIFDFLFSLSMHNDEPVRIQLTQPAKAIWVNFYDRHSREQHEMAGSDLAASWSKLEGYAARFALLVHCVREAINDVAADPFHVDEQSMSAGITLAEWFGYEAKRAYAILHRTPEQHAQSRLTELVRAKGGRVTIRELMRSSSSYSNAGQCETALNSLVQAGIGRWTYPPPGAAGGRPSKHFELIATPIDVCETDTTETPSCNDANRGIANVAGAHEKRN